MIILPKKNFFERIRLIIFCLLLFVSFQQGVFAQVSITNTSPLTETFTGFTGNAAPSNWDIQGTGIDGILWNGSSQTTGTSGGWYGNANMSFLGSGTAINGNATWILQNNSGYSITGFSLAFTAMLWKADIASPSVQVYYEISSSAVVPPQGFSGFTQLNSLTFNDATANITTGASLFQAISSINVPNGYYIFIRFIHDGGINSDNLGWDNVSFTAIIPQVNISTISNAGNIYKGSTNNILQTFTLQPLFSGLTLSGLSINTAGTYNIGDLTATPFKLYYNTSNSLSGAVQLGLAQPAVTSGGTINFSGLFQFIPAATTGYIIITVDIASGATTNDKINIAPTFFSNISFSTLPVKNGTDPTPASALQTIIAYTSAATDYFRSALSGNWSASSTWESSPDGIVWYPATIVPGNGTVNGITISNGQTVTIDNPITVRLLTIAAGGILKHLSGVSFTISNLPAADTRNEFTINGIYILNGTSPTFNANTFAVVNNGGIVRADNNSGGQSDAFASNNKVLFNTGAVFQWNTTLAFNTANTTYFPNSSAGITPIFRLSSNVSFIGSNSFTIFNGKFETTSGITATFVNNGTKYFRDGFGGSGTIQNANTLSGSYGESGVFRITGTNAVIDGSVTLNIKNSLFGSTNDFEIATGATLTISGTPTINIGTLASSGADFADSGTLIINSPNTIDLTYGNFNLNGLISGGGTIKGGSTYTNITVSRSTAGSAGVLYFSTGANSIHNFTMNAPGTLSRVALGTDLVVSNNLTLTKGILATGNNLLTWNNSGGILSTPAIYTDSYIATTDQNGNPLTLVLPYTGNIGFRIMNVNGSADRIFPVSSDFNSPNRMAINMNGSIADYFTVVVTKGDIGNTPLARVNRVWYVSEGTPSGSTATMKLYFTKRNWSLYSFGSAQNDEIENGFLYDDAHFLQSNYSNQFVNNSKSPSTDVNTLYANNTTYPYNSEIYAQYTKGISVNLFGASNGVTGFTRFTVANANGIILPVDITDFKASYQSGKVQIGWTAVNETNIASYTVERSSDSKNFSTLKVTNSRNNAALQNVYTLFDEQPKSGINYYRLKIIDKNGLSQYSQTVSINISNLKTSLVVQPNPVQKRLLHFQTNNIAAGKYNVVIYNSVGQEVLTTSVTIEDNTALQDVALPPSVSVGHYFLRLFNQNNLFTTKFIVAK